MRLIALISVFSATSTLGGITYIANSVNWNSYILNIFEIGADERIAGTTLSTIGLGGVHANKVTSRDLRKQHAATTNAKSWNHLFVLDEPTAGTWCIQEEDLPKTTQN